MEWKAKTETRNIGDGRNEAIRNGRNEVWGLSGNETQNESNEISKAKNMQVQQRSMEGNNFFIESDRRPTTEKLKKVPDHVNLLEYIDHVIMLHTKTDLLVVILKLLLSCCIRKYSNVTNTTENVRHRECET